MRAHIDAALGDLAARSSSSIIQAGEYTRSPTDTPLYSALEKVAQRVYPEATLLPRADGRRHRRALLSAMPDAFAYGFGSAEPRRHLPEVPLAASTATTSASTSSRCGSRRTAGSRRAKTSSGEGCTVNVRPARRTARRRHEGERAGGRPRRAVESCSVHEPVEVPLIEIIDPPDGGAALRDARRRRSRLDRGHVGERRRARARRACPTARPASSCASPSSAR